MTTTQDQFQKFLDEQHWAGINRLNAEAAEVAKRATIKADITKLIADHEDALNRVNSVLPLVENAPQPPDLLSVYHAVSEWAETISKGIGDASLAEMRAKVREYKVTVLKDDPPEKLDMLRRLEETETWLSELERPKVAPKAKKYRAPVETMITFNHPEVGPRSIQRSHGDWPAIRAIVKQTMGGQLPSWWAEMEQDLIDQTSELVDEEGKLLAPTTLMARGATVILIPAA